MVCIDRDSFKRLLGPLDDILKRNFSRYEKYMGWLNSIIKNNQSYLIIKI